MTDPCGVVDPCCPCDRLVHPPKPEIPAGLDSLPRQVVGFPEYRRAMLHEIPLYPRLADWRAREGDDLGILLLEMWAYVLDILGFYDERIADESYLRTAELRPSLRRLVELVGYLPRPALASSVILAAFAEGPDATVVPAGTGVRSQAFEGGAPQVFESVSDATVSPERNEWTVADLKASTFNGRLLLETATASLAEGQIALLRFPGGSAAGHAARVIAVQPIEALDRKVYIAPALDPEPPIPAGTRLSAVEVVTPTLSARQHPLLAAGESGFLPAGSGGLQQVALRGSGARNASFETSANARARLGAAPLGHNEPDLILDALYPQLQGGSAVVVERGGEVRAFSVTTRVHPLAVDAQSASPVTVPVTGVDFSPPLPPAWRNSPGSLTLHFQMIKAGRLTNPAEPWVGESELRSAPLAGPVEPLDSPAPAEVFLHDAKERGVRVRGGVTISPAGAGTLRVDEGQIEARLRTPIKVYGNLIAAIRGESIFNEVLGSGDGSAPFQSFTLAKSPLTYLSDASAPEGRRSTLEVRVNGLLWREEPTFFLAGPEEEIFIVRQNDDGESILTFGDGRLGARLPTGLDNVVATYRHGAGAPAPPANLITQLARPVTGLRGVINPVAAGGGADADRPQDIRRNASTSALTLGRAVSLIDFQALALEFGGVVNAQVDWAWDDSRQRAVVKVWFIGDGGDIEDALKAFLLGQAEPHTPLVVAEATPVPSELAIELEVEPRYTPTEVEQAVLQALTEPETGLLAPQNIPIGCPLFRSRIYEQVFAVAGVQTVRSASLGGHSPLPRFITVPEGHYRDFSAGLSVGRASLATGGGAST